MPAGQKPGGKGAYAIGRQSISSPCAGARPRVGLENLPRGKAAVSRSICVAWGKMSKEQEQLIEAVFESFPEQRNGVKLKNAVAQAIATAAVTSDSGIEEAADLFGYPEEARVALFDMCADYKTNKVLLALWTVYSGPPIVKPDKPGKLPTKKRSPKTLGKASLPVNLVSSGEESEAESTFGDMTEKKKAQMETDLKLTGMSKPQTIAHAASLFAGGVTDPALVEGILYGTAIHLSEWARQLQKNSGVVTLNRLLVTGSAVDVKDHFLKLQREYSDEGMSDEAINLSSFTTSTNSMFEGDDKGYISYVKRVFEKYKGRALPLVDGIDIPLVVRELMSSRSAGSSNDQSAKVAAVKTEVGSLKEELKTMKAQLAQVTSRSSTLHDRLNRMESKDPGASSGTSNKKVCDYCGVFGHIAKDCRKKKSDEADGAAASADAKE